MLARYPNLHEVRLIPTKKDIAFVEYLDEGSATIAKDALHNYKLDGENKIKVRSHIWSSLTEAKIERNLDHLCPQVVPHVFAVVSTIALFTLYTSLSSVVPAAIVSHPHVMPDNCLPSTAILPSTIVTINQLPT